MTTCSPYAYGPVTIDCGPGLATYWVPKHLLRSPKWSNTDTGGVLCLQGVSAAAGHTLVHYLYTGTYQTPETKEKDVATPAHIQFKHALLTFVLASTYELKELERLAKEQIKIHGRHMDLAEVLDAVRKDFSQMAWSWFHEYLHARANEQFDRDYTFFTSGAFIESVGRGTLHGFMTHHLLEMFTKKLTHTLQRRESLDKGKPDAMLDEVEDAAVQIPHCSRYHGGHRTDMCTGSDEMCFEFRNASCVDMDDVISLENSSVPDCAVSGSEIEEVPYPEVSEDQSTVKSDPTQVYEELYELTLAVKIEKHDAPGLESESGEPVSVEFGESHISRISDRGDGSGSGGDGSGEKELAEEERLFKDAEEEAERKKKEEEEAELKKKDEEAAAAMTAQNDMSWAEGGDDGWGSFATAGGKKKKNKKGKVRYLGCLIICCKVLTSL